jgi:hypothetical protein
MGLVAAAVQRNLFGPPTERPQPSRSVFLGLGGISPSRRLRFTSPTATPAGDDLHVGGSGSSRSVTCCSPRQID